MPKAVDLPILRTKLLIPELRHNYVSREGLLDALDERNFGDVVLICGPAGYGKTTLAAFIQRIQQSFPGYIVVPQFWNQKFGT